ncbi:MAG: DUF456 domain-containing protein [Verrucomicrobia bacterium]|nr:DUF456 domain-containing protein [Verrucomicrobiota bacterium]
MSFADLLGLLLTLLVMLLGFAGTILPGLPGTPLIFIAALGHRLWFGNQSTAWWVVIVLGLLAVLSTAMDFLATTYGAKRLGASWRGMVGAVLGAMLGLFVFPPFGLIVLPLVGAALGELIGGQEWKAAGKAGVGASLGVLAGTLGRVGCGLAMLTLWMFNLLWRWLNTPVAG